MMKMHDELSPGEVRTQIKNKAICFAGNKKLKIFGRLNCKSGKRMLRKDRVFFKTAYEAKKSGFRPCGHCLKEKYKLWICSVPK